MSDTTPSFDGDWSPTHPAWLAAFTEPCSRLHVDPRAAARELSTLYPPEVCRDLARTPEGHALIAPLFADGRAFHMNPAVGGMVLLGHDLAACPGWGVKTGLVAMLRDPKAWHNARLEVGIWAGLTRVGLENRYEESEGRSEPTPDHTFRDGGLTVRLETKALDESRIHRNVATLNNTISIRNSLPGASVDPRAWFGPGDGSAWPTHVLRVRPTADLVQRIGDTDPTAFLVFARDLRARVEEWYRRHLAEIARPPFGGTIEGLGDLLVEPMPADRPGGLLEVVLEHDDRGLVYEVARALRLARASRPQLIERPADVRIVLVWVSATWAPVQHAIRAAAERVMRDPGPYLGLDYLLLMNTRKYFGSEQETTVAVAQLPSARHDIRRLRFLDGLTRWRLML